MSELFERTPDAAQAAASHFKAGRFEAAEQLSREALDQTPADYGSTLRLGYLALLNNRLAEAQGWLNRALEIKPGEASARSLLAEAHYRQDDFTAAAPLWKGLGREALARKLESFAAGSAYQLDGPAGPVTAQMVMVDPLPVVEVRLNGGEPVCFLLDTGGAEVIVDAALAGELGLPLFGAEGGVFAGGRAAALQHGRVDSLELGGLVIRNVPALIMDVRRFSGIFGGRRVDGILGTVLLYHFLATIDYAGRALVLRRRTETEWSAFAERARTGGHAARFWMAGDHYMVGWGSVNHSAPMLFFLDTGLVGGCFTCPEATLKEARLRLKHDQASAGLGGGGKVTETPFDIERIAFGEVVRRDMHGVYMGAFPVEHAFGFRIGGLISHEFFRAGALTLDFDAMRWHWQTP
jgi:hypothetical protein